jgi:basic membrane protein A
VRAKRRTTIAAAAVLAAGLAAVGAVAATAGGSAPSATKATVTLVSDVGRFNDKSFNQSQLEGAERAKARFGITLYPLQSNSVSDYIPNLTTGVRRNSDLIISAGFLLANATATMAKKFPDTEFAITDYPVQAPPFGDKKGNPLFKNVTGLTYAANESGCLVGVLAALMARRAGGNAVGVVGGLKIPSVDIWIAGYRHCARLAVPNIRVLVGYSQDFVAADKCRTVAENQISQGAKVLFQVAGGCGLGTLQAAADAGLWGIGVDKDQYNDAKRVLTSGVKRVDTGVFLAIKAIVDGKSTAGTNINFNLKNGGMSVGKINPSVPKAFVNTMNAYKRRIIAGTLKVPAAL